MEWFFSEYNIDKELADLFDAYCNGTASAEELAQLEEILISNPRVMDAFVIYTDAHARLRRWAQRSSHTVANTQAGEFPCDLCCVDDSVLDDMDPPVNQEPESNSPILGFLKDVFQAGTDFLSRGVVLTLLLALGLPGILLLMLMIHIVRQPVTPVMPMTPATVAVITQENGCVWGEATGKLSVGTRLYSGQKLYLNKGLAELAFDNGAGVILQGPAMLEIKSGKKGILQAGKLVAYVPKKAIGFTVATPTATMIDLGTEFGVSVDDTGNSEAHVFTGQIKVGMRSSPADSKEKFELLKVGQATRIEKTQTGNIRTDAVTLTPRQFIRRVPPISNADLPEPVIVFSHQGDRDPSTEGWERFEHVPVRTVVANVSTSPTKGEKTPAWHINDDSCKIGIHYKKEELSPDLIAKAQSKGWVMRARVRVDGHGPVGEALAFCSYCPDNRDWVLWIGVDKDENQCLILHGDSSLGKDAIVAIPDSHGAYVDYEVRYCPRTDDADVYLNGKLVATGYRMTRLAFERLLHFGTFREQKCEAYFAKIEWGINKERHE